jgi:hypothetical protein
MRHHHARRQAPTNAVAASTLMRADPALARAVDHGLRNHYVRTTASSYKTAANDYVTFCLARSLCPWPTDQVCFCGWLHVSARRLKMTSLSMYMAGVRDCSILLGHGWHLAGNEMVRRSLRYLKRKYPAKPKALKLPVTVAILSRILPLLAGWPDMAAMSPDDRTFACASVTAVAGFLRGGEFLASRKSVRPVLAAKDMAVKLIDGRRALVVSIPQPKAAWWMTHQSVPCFQITPDDTFCPVRLWEEYSARCPGFSPKGPAFILRGKPLTRDYMVSRTGALMVIAQVSFVDRSGAPMCVKAASWRSGGACSATSAGVPVPYIMILGRWSSSAWENYILQAPLCLQGSARSMWAAASHQPPVTRPSSVGDFNVTTLVSPWTISSVATDLMSLNLNFE